MKIYCDGGARGNPGPAAAAFVVKDGGGKTIYEGSEFLGETTNNVAEYSALVMALEWASEHAPRSVEIILDSELVKKQMTGEYKIRDQKLKVLAVKAKNKENAFGGAVVYRHVPREKNFEADRLVNQAIDRAAFKE